MTDLSTCGLREGVTNYRYLLVKMQTPMLKVVEHIKSSTENKANTNIPETKLTYQ